MRGFCSKRFIPSYESNDILTFEKDSREIFFFVVPSSSSSFVSLSLSPYQKIDNTIVRERE